MLIQAGVFVIGVYLIRWAVLAYRKRRLQKSPQAREGAEFKQKLTPWVKQVESLLFATFLVIFAVGGVVLASYVHRIVHGMGSPPPIAGTLMILHLFLAAPLALMTANFISWSPPAMRNANEEAMRGLSSVSYQKYQRQLSIFLIWAAPICLL